MSTKTIDKLKCEDCGAVWPISELIKKLAMPAEETERRCPKCGSCNLWNAEE